MKFKCFDKDGKYIADIVAKDEPTALGLAQKLSEKVVHVEAYPGQVPDVEPVAHEEKSSVKPASEVMAEAAARRQNKP